MNSIYKFLLKYGNIIALLFAVLVVIKFVVDFTLGLRAKNFDFGTDLVPVKNEINFFNFTIYLAIVLIALGIIVWLLVELINLAMNLKGSVKFLVSFVFIVVLYFIFYNSANGNEGGRLAELMADPVYSLTPTISRHISAGLWTTFVMFILSIVAFVGSELISMFK
jgi:hypothetical protein